MSHLIEINIKNFRAIREANIGLDGITVVTGENGCGKSTISKLLYQTFKIANQYETFVDREVRASLSPYVEFLREVPSFLFKNEDNQTNRIEYRQFQELAGNYWRMNIADLKQQLPVALERVKKSLTLLSKEEIERFFKTSLSFARLVSTKDDVEKLAPDNFTLWIDAVSKKIMNDIDKAEKRLMDRPVSILQQEIRRTFSMAKLPESFAVYPIVDMTSNRVSTSFIAKEQVYVDTPMSAGLPIVRQTEYQHWSDLNNLLQKKIDNSLFTSSSSFMQHIEDKVLDGSINIDSDKNFGFSRGFLYKRKDGLTINLLDCATGLKSFAILQLLYKNGTLREDTLVIIDEPEAHLHPQWVVEYARLLVLLNKEVGTKFFIASHHPDMIAAIRYIAENEGTSQNLNFYLAEKKQDDQRLYDYKPLGLDIEPIFASFNIALDRISQYGGDNNAK